MKEKINVAELLKDCPKGMELDCTTWENVTFEKVVSDLIYIKRNNKDAPSFDKIIVLNKYGCCTGHKDEKCRIFPKDKNTWEGFHRPFKDGDIVFTTLGNIAIIRKPIGGELFCVYGIMVGNGFYKDETVKVVVGRLASEEEKQKLFDAIKAAGYKWNTETKELEALVEPKFKVGDKIIRRKGYFVNPIEITAVTPKMYTFRDGSFQYVEIIDKDYEVSRKFDISSLKPFDKVLVRNNNEQKWTIDYFSFVDKERMYPFICVGHYVSQCIPYENNEYLLGTTDNCADFYKAWE